MAKPNHIGTFSVVSGELIATDPGYDVDTAALPGLGITLRNCVAGVWNVELLTTKTPRLKLPKDLTVVHENWVTESDPPIVWEACPQAIGGDSGMIGIYDKKHFHDDSIVPKAQVWTFGQDIPADPDDLWYSYNCEVAPQKFGAAVLPYGCVLHSDVGVQVHVGKGSDNAIVGVKLKAVRLPRRA